MFFKKKEIIIPEYDSFYSDKAQEIGYWIGDTEDINKRRKLYKLACKMEKRFRDYNGINNPNRSWDRGGIVTCPMPLIGLLKEKIEKNIKFNGKDN